MCSEEFYIRIKDVETREHIDTTWCKHTRIGELWGRAPWIQSKKNTHHFTHAGASLHDDRRVVTLSLTNRSTIYLSRRKTEEPTTAKTYTQQVLEEELEILMEIIKKIDPASEDRIAHYMDMRRACAKELDSISGTRK